MCQYTKKHKCSEPQYKVTRNGKPRVYCGEAIERAMVNGIIVITERYLTKHEENGFKINTCGCKNGANGIHANFCLFYETPKLTATQTNSAAKPT